MIKSQQCPHLLVGFVCGLTVLNFNQDNVGLGLQKQHMARPTLVWARTPARMGPTLNFESQCCPWTRTKKMTEFEEKKIINVSKIETGN